MTLEFKPTIKSINIASEEMTKITLEVKNGTLDGKYDELRKFSNKSVSILIIPESYSYQVPFDTSTNKPTQRYVLNQDGTIDLIKEEQTQLDVDGSGNIDIVEKTISVDKEIIDIYIQEAPSIKFPGQVNPREVLDQLDEGATFAEIADELEVSESILIRELEQARAYFAPFADAWNKQKDDVPIESKELEDLTDGKDSTETVNETGDSALSVEEVKVDPVENDEDSSSASTEVEPY